MYGTASRRHSHSRPTVVAVRRRPLLLFLVVAAVALVPWIGFLLVTLPDQYQTRHWRLAWVGFDLALVILLASAAWLGWRRRRAAVPVLVATAALLCCDAWFDVVLDWNSPDRWLSLATAVLVEIPIAVLLAVRARTIVTARVASRELTVHDIELVLGNPSAQRLLTLLGAQVMTVDELAAETGLSRAEVWATLGELSLAGYVEAVGPGWREVPLNLHAPRPEDIAEADRPLVRGVLGRQARARAESVPTCVPAPGAVRPVGPGLAGAAAAVPGRAAAVRRRVPRAAGPLPAPARAGRRRRRRRGPGGRAPVLRVPGGPPGRGARRRVRARSPGRRPPPGAPLRWSAWQLW